MPQDADGIMFVLLVAFIVWIAAMLRPRCQYCDVFGDEHDVKCAGTHHKDDCPLYRRYCRYCHFYGSKHDVNRAGSHHNAACHLYRTSCQYCGVYADQHEVARVGTHHNIGCYFYRTYCRTCSIFGTKLETEQKGAQHREHCHLHEGTCAYCDLRGPFHHISNDGYQHNLGCPRRPMVCDGCGVHTQRTILKEPADSLWTLTLQPGEQLRISPQKVKFCQDSISRFFHDGVSSVYDVPQDIPKILACFHQECDGIRLFALNNRTLFNAIHGGVNEIVANIVEKPDDWQRRFTGSRPWMCVKVRGAIDLPRVGYVHIEPQALRLPAPAFPAGGHRSICLVMLEARNLVNPKKDTFLDLLKEMSSELDARSVDGPRAFARVRVNEDDVPLVRSMVKAIAQRMGKNVRAVDCVEVQGMRVYESPRD